MFNLRVSLDLSINFCVHKMRPVYIRYVIRADLLLSVGLRAAFGSSPSVVRIAQTERLAWYARTISSVKLDSAK